MPPLQILHNFLADRPALPQRGQGSQKGSVPLATMWLFLRYPKKNVRPSCCVGSGPKQQQITKNNRFEKQQISKISHFRKQNISKTTTYLKQEISKNNRSQKNKKFQKTADLNETTNFKKQVCCWFEICCWYCNMLFFEISVYLEICCFWNLLFFEICCLFNLLPFVDCQNVPKYICVIYITQFCPSASSKAG